MTSQDLFDLALIDAIPVDSIEIGQYGVAEQGYLEALKIKTKIYGEDAITTALGHNTLASSIFSWTGWMTQRSIWRLL